VDCAEAALRSVGSTPPAPGAIQVPLGDYTLRSRQPAAMINWYRILRVYERHSTDPQILRLVSLRGAQYAASALFRWRNESHVQRRQQVALFRGEAVRIHSVLELGRSYEVVL